MEESKESPKPLSRDSNAPIKGFGVEKEGIKADELIPNKDILQDLQDIQGPSIIIDTDCGWDDSLAVGLLLSSEYNENVRLVTTVGGMHCGKEGAALMQTLLNTVGGSSCSTRIVRGSNKHANKGQGFLDSHQDWASEYRDVLRGIPSSLSSPAVAHFGGGNSGPVRIVPSSDDSDGDEDRVVRADDEGNAEKEPALLVVKEEEKVEEEEKEPVLSDTTKAIMEVLQEGRDTIILTLGPLTNIATLFKEIPKEELIKGPSIHIISMGGSFKTGGNMGETGAEFNFRMDPESVQRVLGVVESLPNFSMTLCPLDTCCPFTFEPIPADSMVRIRDRAALIMSQIQDAERECPNGPEEGTPGQCQVQAMQHLMSLLTPHLGSLAYDAVTAFYILNQNAFQKETTRIHVDKEGVSWLLSNDTKGDLPSDLDDLSGTEVTLLSQLDRRAYSGHLESILGIEEQNPVDAQEQEQEQAAPVREREREQERGPEKEKVYEKVYDKRERGRER